MNDKRKREDKEKEVEIFLEHTKQNGMGIVCRVTASNNTMKEFRDMMTFFNKQKSTCNTIHKDLSNFS